MGCERKFSYFVQEERAPVSLLEIALSGVNGTGEGAFLVSEQFGINGALRNCTAVYGKIFPRPAAAVLVYDSGYVLLSYTAFARYQYGNVRGSHSYRDFQRPVQRRIVPHYVVFIL